MEEKCRVCLREASDSESIGEVFYSDGKDFLFCVCTAHRSGRKFKAEACENSGSCTTIAADSYSNLLCNAIHNVGVSKHNKSEDITVTNVDKNANDKNEQSYNASSLNHWNTPRVQQCIIISQFNNVWHAKHKRHILSCTG